MIECSLTPPPSPGELLNDPPLGECWSPGPTEGVVPPPTWLPGGLPLPWNTTRHALTYWSIVSQIILCFLLR